ncbi:glycosyltransferase family 2 protein [Methylocystis echinoides]|uniref:glycosyltransferase family 2 protein n=1 Tax=Methylocystis echinoides TaxID=29468 RepID=UPI003D81B5AC
MPCYNAERTIAETLDSTLAQKGISLEIVVVDDGSTDNSLAIVRRYEPRVRVISCQNRGVSAARNTGITATKSQWIVFLDADDLLETDTLVRRVTVAKKAQADVAITDWLEVIDDGFGNLTERCRRTIDWAALETDAELATAVHAWATTAAILYSRRIVERVGGFRPELPIIQDARFLFDAAFHGARFARADHMGARYRVLADSLSRRSPERFAQDLFTNSIGIEEMWSSRGSLDYVHRKTLLGLHYAAGRSLFRERLPSYFDAVAAQRRLGLPLPLHSLITPFLARNIGIKWTHFLLSLFSRS